MTLISRLIYRSYRWFSGARGWAERRFTRAGLMVLVSLAGAAALAPDTENTVAYQGLALLFGLLLVAMAFRWTFRARFAVTRLLPRWGTVGSPLRYTLRVRNLTGKTQSGLALLENLADPRPSFAEWLAFQLAVQRRSRSFRLSPVERFNPFRLAHLRAAEVPAAPPGQEVEARVELTPLRRGLLRFSGVALARPDPLGLVRALVRLPLPQTALILPRRYRLPPLALPGTMKYQQGGVALASNVGRSEEFVALRDYRDGDPPRHIHWRSWAKAGKPVVKEFEDEFFVRHALVLDTFTDEPHSEVFEEAVAVAASFACTLQTQESLLDLLFVGPQSYCFTAGRGLAHADQMLEVLASVRACEDQPFKVLEHLVFNHVQAVSGCICVLLDWDEDRQQFIERLGALGLPLLVFVIVPPGGSISPGAKRHRAGIVHVLECGDIEAGLAKLE